MLLQTAKPSLFVLMVTLIIVVMFWAGPCNGFVGECPGNFTPCYCYDGYVSCYGIPTVTVKSIFSKFKTSYTYDRFNLIELPITKNGTTLIIADLIGNVTAFNEVNIYCQGRKSPLIIDANAFRSTKPVTSALSIQYCDLSQLNWGFISNFTSLQYLTARGINNFLTSFYTLPSASLTRLTEIEIEDSNGLNDGFLNLSLRYPEPLKQGLIGLSIENDSLSDFAVNCFLIKWVTPYSKNTLEYLWIGLNNLTKIPNEIRNYKNIESVSLLLNQRPLTIHKNAFYLKKNTHLRQALYFSKVISIEPGAFQGYYGNCYIHLYGGQLKTIDEGVFKKMLEQRSVTEGYPLTINFADNPLDCSSLASLCKMAWLIRDNPSYILEYGGIEGARCANGTYLFELSAMALRYPICP